MTEAEWDVCTNPMEMVASLGEQASSRKLRLFVVDCCRRNSISGKENTYVVAERFADSQATKKELKQAKDEPWEVVPISQFMQFRAATMPNAFKGACLAASAWMGSVKEMEQFLEESMVLRDIFGNPFRPPPTPDPAWLRWHDATIPRLAQQMYDARDFAAMPILADALEEAGCTSADILEHCRGPGPHARGCWVVDLILGKE